MPLRLSRKAQADLDEIRDYGLEWFGAARAIRYLDAFEQAFRRIQAYPALGVARDEAPIGPARNRLRAPPHLLPERRRDDPHRARPARSHGRDAASLASWRG